MGIETAPAHQRLGELTLGIAARSCRWAHFVSMGALLAVCHSAGECLPGGRSDDSVGGDAGELLKGFGCGFRSGVEGAAGGEGGLAGLGAEHAGKLLCGETVGVDWFGR